MRKISTYSEIQEIRRQEAMAFFYFSRPACAVCSAIKPKLINMLKDFPGIQFHDVNLDEVPEAAGQLSLFTIPAVLVYADGREVIREARYMSIDDISEKIRRPYKFLYAD